MMDRNAHPVSPAALVGLVVVVSLGSLCDGAAGGVWCHTVRSEERAQPHGVLMAQWLKGLSQAAHRLHGQGSTRVVAAKLCLYPQLALSFDVNLKRFVDASHAGPSRPPILASLTNLPPPIASI